MREWQKPTIDETESGMEVTRYLPAELVALNPVSSWNECERRSGDWPGSPFRFEGRALREWRRQAASITLGPPYCQRSRSGFLNVVCS